MIKIKNLVNKGEIYIWGNIIDDTDAQWIQKDENGKILGYQYPTEIKKQLDGLKGLPIDVHIASDGGNVQAGIAIHNMLKSNDAPVTVYIDSWAASIASAIAFAGRKIVMPENTFLMIHNPTGGAYGEADYLRSVADSLDKFAEMLKDTYAKHLRNKDINVEELMDKETWLTAREAYELFDNVELVERNEIKAVACYKSTFKNAPKALLDKAVDNKIIDILKRSFEHEETC